MPGTLKVRVRRARDLPVMNAASQLTTGTPTTPTARLWVDVMLLCALCTAGFMEGCVRAEADHGPTVYLSSGTEDYFESANFFSAGTATSTSSFWTISRALLSSMPPNTHRMLCSTSCLC